MGEEVMASVTGRIKEIKQPRGGFLKPSEFDEIVFGDQMCLELKKKMFMHQLLVWQWIT